MTKEANKEQQQAVQQKYMDFQLMHQNMQLLQKQIQTLAQQESEMELILLSVDELSKVEAGTEILVPVANGIFAKAELKDSKNLIINIGAGITVTKSSDKVKKMLSDQLIEILKIQNELTIQMQKLQFDLQKAQKELL